MIELDPRTTIFVNFVYTAFVSGFFIAAWRLGKVEFSGIGNWTVGSILIAANFGILSFRNIIPVHFVMVVPHLMACWAYVEIRKGVEKFYNIKPDRPSIDLFVIIAFFIVLFVNKSNARFRMLSVALFPTIIIIDSIYIVYKSSIEKKKILILLFSFAVIIQLVRMSLGVTWDPGVNPLKTGNSLSLISILFFMTNTVIFFTLLYIVIQRIIDMKNGLLVELEKASTTDELTQINNRRGFLYFLNYEFARMKRSNVGFSIAVGDIDFFKEVNDTYGHNVGDKVLREVAIILKDMTRESDVVARWGGEEFILMLPGTSLVDAVIAVNRIREAVEKHKFAVGEFTLRKTISFGISHTSDPEFDIDSLVKHADNNLYAAKEQGRNRTVF